MRLRFDWAIATTLPIAIESTESTISIELQSGCEASRPSVSKRMVRANAAILGAEPMNSVTQVGEPSYTSGIHM